MSYKYEHRCYVLAVLVPLKQSLVKNGTLEKTKISQHDLKKVHKTTVESGSAANISCKVDHLGDYTVRNATAMCVISGIMSDLFRLAG